jgi:bloom syndrome protein
MISSNNLPGHLAWLKLEKPQVPSIEVLGSVLKSYPEDKRPLFEGGTQSSKGVSYNRSILEPNRNNEDPTINNTNIGDSRSENYSGHISTNVATNKSPTTLLDQASEPQRQMQSEPKRQMQSDNQRTTKKSRTSTHSPNIPPSYPENNTTKQNYPSEIYHTPQISSHQKFKEQPLNSINPQPSTGSEKLLRKLVALQDAQLLLFKERFHISESTSISVDAKHHYYKNKFEPRLKDIENKVSSTRLLLQLPPRPPMTQPSQSIPQSTPLPQTFPFATPNILDEEEFNTFDFSDYDKDADDVQIIPPNAFKIPHNVAKGVPTTLSTPKTSLSEARNNSNITPSTIPNNTTSNFTSKNLNEPRNTVLQTRRDQNVSSPYNELDDMEDDFGNNSMDGLLTPTQDRDESNDLGSFIVASNGSRLDDALSADDSYNLDDGLEVDSIPTTTNDIEDIRLSLDVAQNLGIKYNDIPEIDLVEDEDTQNDDEGDDDDVEEIDDFTTQLNDERELNNVIEVISDEEVDGMDLSPFINNTQPHILKPVLLNIDDKLSILQNIESDLDFSDDDDELMNIINGQQPIPINETTNKQKIPSGSEEFIREVYQVLNNVFKLKSFRTNQLEAVIASLQNKDVFVLMPTGGGKSLCYQLPALIKGDFAMKTTIVISPLISLMQDQVQHLLEKNVKAGMISSKASADDNKQTINLFRDGFLQLVYLSPEKANNSPLVQRIISKLYDNDQLARVVIDEAHCLSSWGHDFRPDYQAMSFFKEKYPKVPIMALTATANEKVRMDIIHHLKMKDPVMLKQSFNRSNLFYEIKWKSANYLEGIKDYVLSKYNGKTGIIYCHSKLSCEQTSAKLNLYGLKTSFYHAGMSPDDRFNIQNMWQTNKLQLICATIAFGMGIDKPDVRFVIHLFIPRSLEGYYQETGRAGRDGEPAECVMFYSYKDARQLQNMIHRDEELTHEGKENHLAKLRQVVQYCENTTDCRRKQVLHYFNESFNPAECRKQCDNCKNCSHATTIEKNCTKHAKDIIQLVRSIQEERVTVLHCQDVFKGANHNKIIKMGHNNNPFHGKGKSLDKTDVERIFFYLLSEECLVEYQVMKAGFASNYVKLGKLADQVLRGQKEIVIGFSSERRLRPSTGGNGVSLLASVSGTSMALNNLSNFKYQDSFVTARQISSEYTQSRINLAPNNFSNDIDSSSKEHIEYSYAQLNKIRIDTLLLISLPIQQVVRDLTLKDMAIKLPTNKRDFSKLMGIAKEQLDYFNYFKRTLGILARERKRQDGGSSANTSTQSATNNAVVSPYFHPSQQDQAILQALRGSVSQSQRPLPKPTVTKGGKNYKGKGRKLGGHSRPRTGTQRTKARAMPL